MQESSTSEESRYQAYEADEVLDSRWLTEAGTMFEFMIDATKALEAIVDAHKAPIWYDWDGEDAWMPNFDTVLNGFHAWIRHYIALLPTEAEAQYLSGLTNEEWRNSGHSDNDQVSITHLQAEAEKDVLRVLRDSEDGFRTSDETIRDLFRLAVEAIGKWDKWGNH